MFRPSVLQKINNFSIVFLSLNHVRDQKLTC